MRRGRDVREGGKEATNEILQAKIELRGFFVKTRCEIRPVARSRDQFMEWHSRAMGTAPNPISSQE